MLIRVLATDPRTPPALLRWLAESAGRTGAEALALATHPHLPAATHLAALRPISSAELTSALSHPTLPARHRSAFLSAAHPTAIQEFIGRADLLTGPEIASFHTGPALELFTASNPFSRGERRLDAMAEAYLNDPATPHDLALAALAHLQEYAPSGPYGPALFTAGALRHHLPLRPTPTGAAPAETYASHVARLIAHARTFPVSKREGLWVSAIDATGDPDIARAALQDCAQPGAYSRDVVAALLRSSRNPLSARREAAVLATDNHEDLLAYCIATIAATAPQAITAALVRTSEAPVAYALAANPATQAPTLEVLLHRWASTPDRRVSFALAIAVHPNCPAALRASATAYDSSRGPSAMLDVANLLAEAPDPSVALLDARVSDLHDRDTQGIPLFWDRLQSAYAATAPATPGQLHAALALDTATFPGTLRDLLGAARAVAT